METYPAWQTYVVLALIPNLIIVLILLLTGIPIFLLENLKEILKNLRWIDIFLILLFFPATIIVFAIGTFFKLLGASIEFFEENKTGKAIASFLSKTPFKNNQP